ncbi:MAG: YkgJ family cysteine cluster protein [Methanoregula sp.]|jgi:Fe-S-cluster containining protein|uniref:YkgJ family cysteine cluster protein n=1 Tax=Methanoregula sp. TaxID=2052170 RepID=UPI003C2393DB
MVFTCRQCGKCCMYLGDYIVIERQTGPFRFECESVSTGTPFTAEVDEDKREIFQDHSFPEQHPGACRFLRPDGDLVRCTIHRDSPTQCKFYRCVVMRVADHDGKPLGYVTGTLALHADDPALRSVWEVIERKRPKPDEEAEPWIAAFLREKGYLVE